MPRNGGLVERNDAKFRQIQIDLGVAGGAPRYAIDVDTERAVVTVGRGEDLLTDSVRLVGLTWVDAPDSGIGSEAKSGGAPGQIAIWTCPGEGCQTAAGAVAAAELVNAIKQAANSLQ